MARSEGKKNLNKKIFYIVCAMVFTFGLLLSTLTLAFFSSKDEVTNKTSASDVEIVLLEPEWYAKGMSDAQTLEPGMVIDKDPQVLNKSDTAVYVRMRIKIVDSNEKDITDEERGKEILSAIYCNNALLLTSDGLSSNNPYFISDTDLIGTDSNLTAEGWFYYYDKTNKKLSALASGNTTEELFSYLKIPTLKKEYNDFFDSDFSIEIEAQAISAGIDETGTNKEIILKSFKQKYEQS